MFVIDQDYQELLQRLTAPASDEAELRLSLQADFQRRMAASGQRDLSRPLSRLRSVQQRKPRRRGLLWFSVAVFLLWFMALFAEAPDLMLWDAWQSKYSKVMEAVYAGFTFSGYESHCPELLQTYGQQRLKEIEKKASLPNPFWAGNEDLADWTARLHQKYPDSPAIYYAYVSDYRFQNNKLPDDFDETWRRIDPDNGAWLVAKAVVMSDRAITRSGKGIYTVTDPGLLAQAIAAFGEGLRMPRFNQFRQEQRDLIRSSLGTPHTYAEASIISDLEADLPRGFRPSSIWWELRTGGASRSPSELAPSLDILLHFALLTRLSNPSEPDFWGSASSEFQFSSKIGLTEQRDRFLRIIELDDPFRKSPYIVEAPPPLTLLSMRWNAPGESRLRALGDYHLARFGMLGMATLCLAGTGGIALLTLFTPRFSKASGGCMSQLLPGPFSARFWMALLLPLGWTLLHALWLPFEHGGEWLAVTPYVVGTGLVIAWATLAEVAERGLTIELGFLHASRRRILGRIDRVLLILAWLAPLLFWAPAQAPDQTRVTVHWIGVGLSGVCLIWLLLKTLASLLKREANLRRLLLTGQLLPMALVFVVILLAGAEAMFLWERWAIRQPGLFTDGGDPAPSARVEAWKQLKREWYGD